MTDIDAIRREYDETAREYDERWSYYIRATTRETLARLTLPDGARVLDVGCGTGALLDRLRQLDAGDVLAGVDLSPRMLSEAVRKTDRTIPVAAADAAHLPFSSREFDVVVSCNSFHFFIRPEQFLSEANRVLRPGGLLLITDWCDEYWACWLCDYYLRFTNEAHTQIFNRTEMRTLLEGEGFRVESMDSYKIDWLWGLMTVAATSPAR